MTTDNAYRDAHAALQSHLKTYSNFPKSAVDGRNLVKWPNTKFEPDDGAWWLSAHMMPATPGSRTGGSDSKTQLTGLYNIGVYVPPFQGPGLAERIIGELSRHFRSSQPSLTFRNVRVRITGAPRVMPAIEETDWYHIPLHVPWRFFAYGL